MHYTNHEMKYYYTKLKYILMAANRYNQDKNVNSLKDSQQSFILYTIVLLNVYFILTKVGRNSNPFYYIDISIFSIVSL